MNIFKFELKMLRSSILIWTVSIVFFVIFYMVFFPLVMVDNDAFMDIMASYPEEFLAFFGMSADLSFTSLMGYYALTMSFVLIPLAIQAAHYGFSILSIEERELTADFLLTKPISRRTIFLSKFSAGTTALVLTNLSVWLASFISLYSFNAGQEVEVDGLVLVLSSLIFFQLFFFTAGMAISVMLKKINSVISYSMGLGFGLFIVSSLGDMLSNKPLQIISIYSHFHMVDMMVERSYNWSYVSITIVLTIILFVLGYFLYQRRNIKSL